MKKILVIYETNVFAEEDVPVLETLSKLENVEVLTINGWHEFLTKQVTDKIVDHIKAGGDIFPRCSIMGFTELIKLLQLNDVFEPTMSLPQKLRYGNIDVRKPFAEFDFTNFSKYFSKDVFLNWDYGLRTVGDVQAIVDVAMRNNHNLFMRSNSGDKLISGALLTPRDWLLRTQVAWKSRDIPENTLVVVASEKKIMEEFRVVVVNGTAICATHYKSFTAKEKANVDLSVIAPMAQSPLWKFFGTERIFPRASYVIDIALVVEHARLMSANYRVIEMNCLFTASLYDVNTTANIIKEIQKQ